MRPPNIVLILADDMGYGDLGVFGNKTVQTPTLDQLARESITLIQHYSASPVCAPARAALLTGRYPHRTGAIDTLEGRGLDRLSLSEITIADVFRDAGYVTGLVGKWHLGALDTAYHPNSRGFDEFLGFRGGWSDYYQWRLDRNGAFERTDGRYLTDVFADEAVRFVERHKDEAFFLHVAFNAPHFPFQAPEEDVRPFLESEKLTQRVSVLYGMIRCMDRGIGRILETLEECGVADNTIVLFTSDNGPQMGGEGQECLDRFNAGWRGYKGLVFEGGIRVPAIVRWPDGLNGGSSMAEFVHFTDWMPTLLAMANVDWPESLHLDGENVLPLLQGETRHTAQHFWQWNRYTPVASSNAAMRDGKWKLVRPVIAETMHVLEKDGKVDRMLKYEPEKVREISREPWPEYMLKDVPDPLLFNLDDDPYEQFDLAANEPERVREMVQELEAWFATVDMERRNAVE